MAFYPIIGIETHVQLNTKTKLFCSCANEFTPDEPNKNICPFCTGQPGALPTLNKEAVKKAIKLGIAVNGTIPKKTRWDRKNYFYPDSPAGYQISQYDNPIIEGGQLDFYIEDKTNGQFSPYSVKLTRAHLEGDAGKLMHSGNKTFVDFNRSGVPLIEIVTEPEMHNSSQAMAYISELQLLVRRIGISDADMEKGQMRFDCNISLQTEAENATGQLPSYKVEIKNVNSVRAMGRAVEFEIQRQTAILQSGSKPEQETRGWRDDLNQSEIQRSKEEAMDYRYFPEPDLRILEITESDIDKLRDLPELPNAQRQRYLDLGLSTQTANTFVSQSQAGQFFDSTLNNSKLGVEGIKICSNIITVNLLGYTQRLEKPIDQIISTHKLIEITELVLAKKINNKGLTKLIELINDSPEASVSELVEANGLKQVSDDNVLTVFAEQVLENNPEQVAQYKSGKLQILDYLVGQCMRESKGKGNPQKFREILQEKLR
ncbi:MAG: Asp-tRNA(Asn)/Glu-tRNA(Gln) amidotransferase subunit GatB [Patescibacteria group bacterium]